MGCQEHIVCDHRPLCVCGSQKRGKGKDKAESLGSKLQTDMTYNHHRPLPLLLSIISAPAPSSHTISPTSSSSSSFSFLSLSLSTGSTRLPNNKRQEVLENGTLVLREIEKVADDGSYSCRGSDGQELSSMRLIILGMTNVFPSSPSHLPPSLTSSCEFSFFPTHSWTDLGSPLHDPLSHPIHFLKG